LHIIHVPSKLYLQDLQHLGNRPNDVRIVVIFSLSFMVDILIEMGYYIQFEYVFCLWMHIITPIFSA
jgi:hypothetical protein